MSRSAFLMCASMVLINGACVTDEPAPDEAAVVAEAEAVDVASPSGAVTLLAAVDRANGSRVEFLEDLGGRLVISEAGAAGEAPSVTVAQVRGIHPVALYRALSGGAEAPAALGACAARTPRYAALDPDEVVVVADPAPSRNRAAGCSRAWFDATICDHIVGNDFQWCRTNDTGNHTHSENDVHFVWTMACADVGDITMIKRTRTWWDWDTSEWTVKRGTYRWWSTDDDGGYDFDFSARIRDAGGDRYHVAGLGCSDDPGWDACLNTLPI